MSYRTILVHTDSSSRCQVRVELACQLARRFGAHVIGLNALSAVYVPGYAVSLGGGQVFIESQKSFAAEQAAQAEALFKQAVARADVASAEWRASKEDAPGVVAMHARYADLVVIGQHCPSVMLNVDADFAERVVIAAGRPVLLVPYAGSFPTLGRRVLIAWNATREATRAVTDAIPLLRQAELVQVTAFRLQRGAHGEEPGADIALFLTRHGVRVEVKADYAEDIDVGNELLSRAADMSADLIVMGAYGHSRLKEMVLGGATRTILDTMTVPVLMAH